MIILWSLISLLICSVFFLLFFCLKNQKFVALALSIFVLITSVSLYEYFGSSQKLKQWYIIKPYGSIANIISALKEKIQHDPNNPQGWYLLGKLYLSQQQFLLAAKSLQKANILLPNDPKIMQSYNESLNLLALDAYQQKHFAQAISYWLTLRKNFAAGSDAYKAITSIIDKTNQQLKLANAPDIKLQIKVVLTKKLQKLLATHDFMFVYAKAVNGPPMPLAVMKLPVKYFHTEVILTKKEAMMPTLTLADYDQVKIYARISHSGYANPSSGDMIGESKIINPHTQKQVINIFMHM